MKKLLAVILLNGCLLPSVWAAITLSGQVVANHEAGAPMGGVRVSAQGANSTETDSAGRFALVFPNGEPGQPIEVKVAFGETDSLINRFALIRPLSAVNTPPFQIILNDGNTKKTSHWVGNFYHQKIGQILQSQSAPASGVAAAGATAGTYKDTNKGSLVPQEQMMRHRTALALQLGNYSARQKSNDYYNAAMRLLGEAKLDAALAQLDPASLKKLPTASEQNREEAAQTWQLRAQLLALRADFAAAAEAYEPVRQLQPRHRFHLNAYGVFHNIQGNYAKSNQAFETILTLARAANQSVEIIVALQNSANAHIGLKQYAAARKKFEEAIALASNFPQEGITLNPHLLARSLRHLLDLDLLEKRLPQALQGYQQLVAEQRKLFKDNPDDYRSRYASDLLDYGKLALELGQPDKARLQFEEALQVLRSAKTGNTPDFLARLVPVLHALAEQNMAEQRSNEAVALLLEVIKHYRTLEQTSPEQFLPLLGLGLNQLGTLYVAQNKLAEASAAFEEQLALHRKLALKDPANHLLNVADTLMNLAALHQASQQNDDARKKLLEARGIYQRLKHSPAQTFDTELRKIETLLAQLAKNK